MPDISAKPPHSLRVDFASALLGDPGQELREAVCDAVLERTRKVVSGEGEFGAAIYRQHPSRVLTSGFLLPRLSLNGDDESTDITIALHGLDFHLQADSDGAIEVVPRFNVYVRALPTVEDIFNATLGLVPRPELSAEASAKRKAMIDLVKRSEEYRALSDPKSREAARQVAITKFYKSILVDVTSAKVQESEGDQDGVEDDTTFDILDPTVRIADEHTMPAQIPAKYLRLSPTLPTLRLSLPYVEGSWEKTLKEYNDALNAVIAKTFIDWLVSQEGKDWAWRDVEVKGSHFWEAGNWAAFLEHARSTPPGGKQLISTMTVVIMADVRRDPLTPKILTVRLGLENNKRGSDEKRDRPDSPEEGIFQTGLTVTLPTKALRWMPMERVGRSYHFAGFLSVPSIGVNGGVTHRPNGDAETLATTWSPKFVLPRMRATQWANVPVDFKTLGSGKLDISNLFAFPEAMDRWIGRVEADTELCEPGEEGSKADEERQRLRFQADLKAWKRERSRISLGIRVLERSQCEFKKDPTSLAGAPYRAWLCTNRVFEKATTNPGWRLFQLGFILTHVPTLASRIPAFEDVFDHEFDEGSASLLYMSTGGGKSESFFGVLVFALFLDRMRGKTRGITAMLHYPLRLLTLQQARRLMTLLARAELIRRAETLAGAPFELGFWVGKGNTPNNTNDKDEMRDIPKAAADPFLKGEFEFLAGKSDYEKKVDSWNKIPSCPFCGSRTGLRMFPEEHDRLGIVCSNGDCDWNRLNDTKTTRQALPFLIVDSDIYRHAPSVLLGTVDKLALLGNHPNTITRIVGMFGMARVVSGDDDTGLLLSEGDPKRLEDDLKLGRPVAPAFEGGVELFHDPFPSLIIQDELHLLEESLGTFGGLFETTLFALFRELATNLGSRACRNPAMSGEPRLPHVIGATATAKNADRQMKHLYQREAVQFPHPGPRLYGSFYTKLSEFTPGGDAAAARGGKSTNREKEANAPWARVYASLLTNGKTHTSATIDILSAYATTITRWTRDLCSPDAAVRSNAVDELVANLSEEPLRPRHAAAIRTLEAAGGFGDLATLVDLHRIMLTYVTNKKGGDQIMSALDRQVVIDHRRMGPQYEISAFDVELISGGVDIKGIQDVIRKADNPLELGVEDIDKALRSIVATSAISHGVDVSAFNAMAFAGMPTDVAEYIQASSRIGRTHVGFSLLIPTPQTRRDRFALDNHESFHRFLERMIDEPAIERWADKAIMRTLPSLIQVYYVGVEFQRAFCEAPTVRKSGVVMPYDAPFLRRKLTGPSAAKNKADLIQFLAQAIGVDADHAQAPDRQHCLNMLAKAVDEIAAELATGNYGGRLDTLWQAPVPPFWGKGPMTSLRDVDEAGTISGSHAQKDYRQDTIPVADVAFAMDFVTKRRIVGRKSKSMAGELVVESGGS